MRHPPLLFEPLLLLMLTLLPFPTLNLSPLLRVLPLFLVKQSLCILSIRLFLLRPKLRLFGVFAFNALVLDFESAFEVDRVGDEFVIFVAAERFVPEDFMLVAESVMTRNAADDG
jgi:hypothetical protein